MLEFIENEMNVRNKGLQKSKDRMMKVTEKFEKVSAIKNFRYADELRRLEWILQKELYDTEALPEQLYGVKTEILKFLGYSQDDELAYTLTRSLPSGKLVNLASLVKDFGEYKRSAQFELLVDKDVST